MSTINVNKVVDTSGGVLAPISSVFRNRIINGAMVIDQRSAGASSTASVANAVTYVTCDRWAYVASQASKFTIQQNAGSVTTPAGFTNYLGITSSSAYTVSSSDFFLLRYNIEGFNTSDLAFGTANAKTITLSFLVYSSLTGTFGGAIGNSANTRTYPFSYTVSVANTWTQISITIPGDTTGTWVGATNGIGLKASWSLGTGSTYSGTAGSWAGSEYYSSTGATSVVGTNGATFYITGVQLEKGSTATSFDYRPYGTELALCQRYFEKSFDIGTAVANSVSNTTGGAAVALNSSALRTQPITFQVAKRSNAVTVNFYNATQPASPTANQWTWYNSGASAWLSATGTAVTDALVTTNGFSVNMSVSGATTGYAYLYTGNWTVSAEL